MADTKISDLAAVTDLQDTDELVLARAGTTKKIDGVDLKSEVIASATAADIPVTDSGGNYTATTAEAALAEVADRGGVFWDDTIVKQVDETLGNSTTLQDDNELVFPVLANTPTYFELLVYVDSPAAADFKHAFSVSAGSVVRAWRNHDGLGSTTAVAQTGVVADMSTVIIHAGTTFNVFRVSGVVTVDSAANVTFQWAKNSADAGTTTVFAGSLIRYRNMLRLTP